LVHPKLKSVKIRLKEATREAWITCNRIHQQFPIKKPVNTKAILFPISIGSNKLGRFFSKTPPNTLGLEIHLCFFSIFDSEFYSRIKAAIFHSRKKSWKTVMRITMDN